jgi:glycosyltransferase involved in cell wall biosynthesis
MKILMLTPYLPYPDSSGGQIRTQNLLKHLRCEHEITLFSLIKKNEEKKYIPILEKNFCHQVKVFNRPEKPWSFGNILRTGFSCKPFLVVRNFSKEAKKAISLELSQNHYDLIHVETFYAMPHLPKTKTPVVLVDQTIEYQVYHHYVHQKAPLLIRPLLNIDVAKLKYWERFYWRQADKVIAVSKEDKDVMVKLEPGLNVSIVPNGVNLDFFKPKTSWNTTSPIMLFVGNFHWLQNTEAAECLINEILPLVKKEIPKIKLMIVGQHQPESLLNQASADVVIKNLPENDTVGIIEAYHQSTVFVSPIKGPGGTRLKNLAAMASQLPIVSTSVGVHGLGVKDGKHVMIRNTPQAMANAIIEIIKRPQIAQKIANTARDYVEKNYDYKNIAKHLSQIYQSVKSKT